MNAIFRKNLILQSAIVPLMLFAIAFALWAGLSRQGDTETYPGYSDRGDAYSEQIIRNTLINAFVVSDDSTMVPSDSILRSAAVK